MLKVPRRSRSIRVALPGSMTRDIPHLREKTAKIGLIGRTLAIFRVDQLIIYRDEPSKEAEAEAMLLEKIIRFQETPQYLRRHLFRIEPDLQFTGILPPLRMPSHPGRGEPHSGEIREAVVVASGSVSRAEAGFKQHITLRSKLPVRQRITVRVLRSKPVLEGELIDPDKLRIYWGFRVKREDATLAELVKRKDQDLTISTSRKGGDVRDVSEDLKLKWMASTRPLVLFGSPSRGVAEILADSGAQIDDLADYNLNMIPGQGVETVRTEEALVASLSVLNILDAERS